MVVNDIPVVIHNQIEHLAAGVSTAMKNKVPFRNISGMSKWKQGVRV